ncbi:MAG: B12-binding domain-containing radical SAM protein [Candidatus Helarchaeota archaeon]|nr:B12-binding domain-containing radical SAM protein [Candidatus Helarchaeota archaeon]
MAIPNNGATIVLTGAETEMSDYNKNPVEPFFSGAISRRALFFTLFTRIPPIPCLKDGTVKYAPYGLRKIEAALRNKAITDIVTVHPKYLKRHIGPNTKIVAITSMNPLGMTYCDRTFTALAGFGDESRNAYYFRKLLHSKVLRKNNHKIVVGGAGAWQIQGPKMRNYFGIDHVIIGEGELTVPEVFGKLLRNEAVPPVIRTKSPQTDEEIPLIQNAAIFGTVEVSRGCGRGCKFCTPNRRRRRDFSIERVIKETQINIEGGQDVIFTATEDALLYGCRHPKFIPNEEAVLELYQAIADNEAVRYIMPAHISLAAINAAPNLIPRLTEIYRQCSDRLSHHFSRRGLINIENQIFFGAETGIESGSPRLIKKYMPGKVLPFTPEEWPEVVMQALGILNDSDWRPLASMMVGMPGETDEDTIKSIELVDRFKNTVNMLLIPVFFTPLGDTTLWNKRAANLGRCTELQKEFFVRVWEYNIHAFSKEWGSQLHTRLALAIGGSFLYNFYYRWKKHRSFYHGLLTRIAKLR